MINYLIPVPLHLLSFQRVMSNSTVIYSAYNGLWGCVKTISFLRLLADGNTPLTI